MRSSSRAISAALATILVVSACGSDDTGTGAGDGAPTGSSVVATLPDTTLEPTPDTTVESTPDTTVETSPDTTTATSEPEDAAQDVAADTAAAESALLSAEVLPEGWTSTARESATATSLDARLGECVGVDGDRLVAADAAATSEVFASPDGSLVVTQDVGIRASERDARSVVAFLVEPSVPGCIEAAYAELAVEAFAGTVAEGAEFGAPTAARLQVGSVGDATQAIRVVVPVTGDPSVVAFTVDHVIVRSGRALASLTFENRTEATAVETIDAVTALVGAALPA